MFKVPAYFTGYNRKKDRSVKLSFNTQEIDSDDLKIIDDLVMNESFGFLLFAEDEVGRDDIPDEMPSDDRKTPSQRLRDVLFVLFKETKKEGDFNTFYRAIMEQITEHYKAKIPD